MGGGYLAECIIAAANTLRKEETYRVYETDCLYGIAKALGVGISRRYYDVLHPQPEDDRTSEEIMNERLERFGIKVVA